jgi:hypothetical protein
VVRPRPWHVLSDGTDALPDLWDAKTKTWNISAKTPSQMLAELDVYAGCMRTHGVPNFPDPNLRPNGKGGSSITVQVPGPAGQSPRFKGAQTACKKLMPAGGASSGGPVAQPQRVSHLLAFAACMRKHGVPNFPDPDSQGNFPPGSTNSINKNLPSVLAALKTCLPTADGAIGNPGGAAH